ncbi:MAG: YtxH domain-containing protein [Bavariicoccus seileri]|uniref:YtxH domain-containing protein n=1 Tax=Bavariicoccus seileri TaxID=549685 RepID=UPI0003B54C4B|nr:YtxH domain-containing protein [Bavariicoccus seileri]
MGFFKGLIVGGLVSGIATLLYTPNDGKTNQKIVKDYLETLAESVDDLTDSTTSLSDALDRFKTVGLKSLTDATQGITDSVERFDSDTKPRVRRINAEIESLSNSLDDLK